MSLKQRGPICDKTGEAYLYDKAKPGPLGRVPLDCSRILNSEDTWNGGNESLVCHNLGRALEKDDALRYLYEDSMLTIVPSSHYVDDIKRQCAHGSLLPGPHASGKCSALSVGHHPTYVAVLYGYQT
jgi:hypothetical protein